MKIIVQPVFFLLIFTTISAFCIQDINASTVRVSPLQLDDRYFRQDVIYVKFLDNLNIRLIDGVLTDFDSGILDELQLIIKQGRWERVHQVPENRLLEMQNQARMNLGHPIPDLSMEFFYYPAPGQSAQQLLDYFSNLNVVVNALGVPIPVLAPLPPNFEPDQGYLDPAGTGLNAEGIWSSYANRGAGVKVCDIEYTFNANHDDLPATTIVGPTPQDPGFGNDHGTAVMGVIGALNNGWGTTGIASDCQLYFAGSYTNSTWNIGAAITNALTVLGNGDVILLEQQFVGPNGGANYVPVEWYLPTYNAIVTAVGLGVNVVEAAGNGGENLDGPEFATGNGGHYPFLTGNESGAIIVGSANIPAVFGGTDVARSRRGSSCYGSRLDLQAWGTRVYTTGYGSSYNAEGANREYTGSFSGTSSASAIIAGGVALFQSVYKTANSGLVMAPPQLKNFLIATGQLQTSGFYPATQHIGPFPDLLAASQAAVGVIACADVNALYESSISATSVRLNWLPSANADHYEIRGNVVGASGYINLPVPNGAPNYFDVTNLVPGASYFWEIRAYCNPDETQFSLWSASNVFTTAACVAPLTNFTSSITASSVRLNWSTVSGATGYRINGRALSGSFVTINIQGGATSFFDVVGLATSTTYEWRVAALCGITGSAYTDFTTFTTNAQPFNHFAIETFVNERDLRVFPNPASGKVSISTSRLKGPFQVSLMDMNGKAIEIHDMDQLAAGLEIDIDNLEMGIYLIQVRNEKQQFIRRLVVAR